MFNSILLQLVAPNVKRALADAAQYLRRANTKHTITSFLAPARPDPLTINELVNDLCSVFLAATLKAIEPNFPFLCFRVLASPLAHANCAHAAHTGLSQV